LFHFFVTKSTQEGWTFVENVRDVLQDPNLQTTLTEYGFTSQFVKDRVQDGQVRINFSCSEKWFFTCLFDSII